MAESGHERIESLIQDLRGEVYGGIFSSDRKDYRRIWDLIRTIGRSFKGVRFPSRDAHQEAWDAFQDIVTDVKRDQEQHREEIKSRSQVSESHLDAIKSRANAVSTGDDAFGEVILTLATGGAYLIAKMALDAILGPYDEAKANLQASSEQMKAAWNLLSEKKEEMLGRDRAEAFRVLRAKQDDLDAAWTRYKQERKATLDKYHAQKRQRHAEWQARTSQRADELRERIERLERARSRKEEHLAELRQKYQDAWSDDFRDRVAGWIAEEESAIADISEKIDRVNGWLNETLEKLSS